jgi:hypothetical protein
MGATQATLPNGAGGSAERRLEEEEGRERDGPLWLLLGHRIISPWSVGLTSGLGAESFFFLLFSFSFYFFHFLCYGVASFMHMESITLTRLIKILKRSSRFISQERANAAGGTRGAQPRSRTPRCTSCKKTLCFAGNHTLHASRNCESSPYHKGTMFKIISYKPSNYNYFIREEEEIKASQFCKCPLPPPTHG